MVPTMQLDDIGFWGCRQEFEEGKQVRNPPGKRGKKYNSKAGRPGMDHRERSILAGPVGGSGPDLENPLYFQE
jgi:hypothetical protein